MCYLLSYTLLLVLLSVFFVNNMQQRSYNFCSERGELRDVKNWNTFAQIYASLAPRSFGTRLGAAAEFAEVRPFFLFRHGLYHPSL